MSKGQTRRQFLKRIVATAAFAGGTAVSWGVAPNERRLEIGKGTLANNLYRKIRSFYDKTAFDDNLKDQYAKNVARYFLAALEPSLAGSFMNSALAGASLKARDAINQHDAHQYAERHQDTLQTMNTASEVGVALVISATAGTTKMLHETAALNDYQLGDTNLGKTAEFLDQNQFPVGQAREELREYLARTVLKNSGVSYGLAAAIWAYTDFHLHTNYENSDKPEVVLE